MILAVLMSAVSQAQECSSVITLKGSTQIVSEFFRKTRSDGVGESWFINTQCVLEFSINNILYQRGIYPPESFDDIKQYGLKMVTTNDPDLKTYLETVLSQMTGKFWSSLLFLSKVIQAQTLLHNELEWLREGFLQQIVLVVTGEEDKAVLERWVFNIETDKEVMLNKE